MNTMYRNNIKLLALKNLIKTFYRSNTDQD